MYGTAYVVTDKTDSVANYVIDDTAVSDETTWSSEKIQSAVTPINIIDITQDIDLNDIKATGYYTPNVPFSTGVFTHSILHAPTNGWLPAGGFALEVKNFSSNWNTQVLYSYVGADNASAPVWTRTFFYDSNSGSVFTPWKRIADIDDSKISSDETWSSTKINSSVVLKNSQKLSTGSSTSSGTTTFTFDISKLNLSHDVYHFKIYIIGNANIGYFAEGGLAMYNGSYGNDVSYKSEKITSITLSNTTVTVTTNANYYIATISVKSASDWLIS